MRLLMGTTTAVALLALSRRNRGARSQPLYGDARFATEKEIEAAGLFAREGVLVGRLGRRPLVFSGQQFVLVAAPTRSGKGVSIVIPNLLTYPGSVVVLDIKEENYRLTHQYRRAGGQIVYRFAPFARDSAHYNPLEMLSSDPDRRFSEVLAMAASLYPATSDQPFWNEQAANLFLGLVLYLCESADLPRTMGGLLKLAGGNAGLDIRRYMTRLIQTRDVSGQPLSDACKGALARFAANSEAAAAGVLSSFFAPLLVFADPLVAHNTASSDFSLKQLREVQTSIYLCIEPQHLKAARVILNLFFTQLIYVNTQALPEAHHAGISCLLLMDEFTSIGRMDILAHAVAFMSGYGLRLVTIVQSVSQLISVYGEQDARTLIANHALKVVFAPNELRDARDLAETLGMTSVVRSEATETKSAAPGQPSRRTVRDVERARPLMLAQELRALPMDDQIILLDYLRPIRASKMRYFEDPRLRARVATGNAQGPPARPTT